MNVAYLIKIIIPAYCTFFIPCKNTVGYPITSQSHGVCILVHNEPVQWIGSEEYLCEILYIYFVAFWTSLKIYIYYSLLNIVCFFIHTHTNELKWKLHLSEIDLMDVSNK